MARPNFFLLLLTYLFSVLTFTVLGSPEHVVQQIILGKAVAVNVNKNCPTQSVKFLKWRQSWKQQLKDAANQRNRIRDYSRFQPDKESVNLYTSWICSGVQQGPIYGFPPTDKIAQSTELRLEVSEANVPLDVIDNLKNERDDDLTASSFASSNFELQVNPVSILSGLIGLCTGLFMMYFFITHQNKSPVGQNKLRRPEL